VLGIASLSYAGENLRSFRGEISDSQCAMNVHSLTHSHLGDAEVQGTHGGNFSAVYYPLRQADGGENLSWQLEENRSTTWITRREAGKFAGQRFKISGTLNAKTKTIHVAKTEPED